MSSETASAIFAGWPLNPLLGSMRVAARDPNTIVFRGSAYRESRSGFTFLASGSSGTFVGVQLMGAPGAQRQDRAGPVRSVGRSEPPPSRRKAERLVYQLFASDYDKRLFHPPIESLCPTNCSTAPPFRTKSKDVTFCCATRGDLCRCTRGRRLQDRTRSHRRPQCIFCCRCRSYEDRGGVIDGRAHARRVGWRNSQVCLNLGHGCFGAGEFRDNAARIAVLAENVARKSRNSSILDDAHEVN